MASPAAPTEFSQETARKSLIAISQSSPETPSSQEVKTLIISTAENGKLDDGADKYRLKLMSITDLSSDAQPTQCPPSSQEVKTPIISTAKNGKLDDEADKYRSKLMSITDLSSDAQPTQCPPENVAA